MAKAKGVEIALEKVDQRQDIVSYGVMSMLGVVIDGAVVHSGGVPARSKEDGWFQMVG